MDAELRQRLICTVTEILTQPHFSARLPSSSWGRFPAINSSELIPSNMLFNLDTTRKLRWRPSLPGEEGPIRLGAISKNLPLAAIPLLTRYRILHGLNNTIQTSLDPKYPRLSSSTQNINKIAELCTLIFFLWGQFRIVFFVMNIFITDLEVLAQVSFSNYHYHSVTSCWNFCSFKLFSSPANL